jgi:hypothetical protein
MDELTSVPQKTSRTDRRHRGSHSTACKCPHPEWFAPSGYRSLPGELGHAMRQLVMRDKTTGNLRLRKRVSLDPHFVFLRRVAGRVRNFRPDRSALIDSIFPLLVQRVDLATWIVTVNISRLAAELSVKDADGNVIPETRVEPSRLSRLFPELARFGIIELPELEWDPIERYWMPRHIRLTDRFWQLCGVNMDKLLAQRNARLARGEGSADAGTLNSVREARNHWYEQARQASLRQRRERSAREKRRKCLSLLSLDERRIKMSSWLIKMLPNHELFYMDSDSFNSLVWQHLHLLGHGYESPIPDKTH